ncbi:MAG: ComF family protein [Clostridium sp.]|uniref:ComF family protein n=1 Tax=Clostridium sp. TaxID=1506 RepID=UPI003044263A
MGRGLFETIKSIINSVLNIIYCDEDKCLMCEKYEDLDYICNECKNDINIVNLKYNIEYDDEKIQCNSLGFYSYGLKKLILAFKYEKNFFAGQVLSRYMSEFILSNLKESVDIITFIPSSEESLKNRGFNQCEVLCEFISKSCGIPCGELLYKIKDGKDQIGLDNKKRWDNVKDSFDVRGNKNIEGKRILLIDDVITSGATGFYAAKALKKAKINEVFILTVAKSRV